MAAPAVTTLPRQNVPVASPRNLRCPKRLPLSPRPLQERPINHAEGAKPVAALHRDAVAKSRPKQARPPTGIPAGRLGKALVANTPRAKVAANALPNLLGMTLAAQKGQKLPGWPNLNTLDYKLRTAATQSRTKSSIKSRTDESRRANSPLANKLKQFPVQSNCRHTAIAVAAKLERTGNYVSPRCRTRKAEGTIKVNTSASVATGSARITNSVVAIKIYDKFRLLDPQRKKSVNREIQILQKLCHPHIVKLIETIDTIKQLYLVLECVKGKSLYTYLKSTEGRRLSECESRRLFRQIVSGIDYCHRRNVSHRDIKLENLLLNEQNDIKIIDFGFATCVPAGTKLKVFCGTPSYMAPEIVTKKEYCGPPADMWALGVLLFAMLSGKFPFKGATERELYKKVAHGEFTFPVCVGDKAKSLIRRLMSVDPLKRPTCEDVLLDPFMVETREKSANMPHIDFYKPAISSKYNKDIISKIVCVRYDNTGW